MSRSPLIKIGNASGFWGDSPNAPARLLTQQPDLDYLTLDYLAEVSLSIMAIQRQGNPLLGYATDFTEVIKSLIPLWKTGLQTKIIANAGGLHPRACAKACQEILHHAGIDKKIGLVEGDDVLSYLQNHPEEPQFCHLDSKEPLLNIHNRLITANAYLGGAPIARALALGADIVITGRVADPSLTVGPCLYHFQWKETDFQKIAGATVAGHLIECGTQATGGISTDWLHIPGKSNIGFPVVEIYEDGSCVLTKPRDTGGEVSLRTTKEQLLYEIGDPHAYLSPDATVSFLGLSLVQESENRVGIRGAIGSAPPSHYKVSATYQSGYRIEGSLAIPGPDALLKAHLCGEILWDKMEQAGCRARDYQIQCIGGNALVPNILSIPYQPNECMLRVAAADMSKEPLEFLSREIASLVTSGPQGVTGYLNGRPKVRKVFGYWPCLIERNIQENVCLYEE